MARMTRASLILATAIIALVFMVQIPVAAESIDSQLGDAEVKMGNEAAVEIAKENKLSDNAADLKRVREIGAKLAEVANKTPVDSLYGTSKITPFQYTFDIIEDKDVNAFCIPGGHIYVYRGLLDFIESDQELAGVLAHEVTHAAHHHMVYLLKKQAGMQNAMAIAMLAMILAGKNSADMENIALGVQLYQIAKVNGYGMQAERDSDHGAVFYTKDAGYNPVGLLTFLERLAQQPELIDYGIYRSHPLDADRIRATQSVITQLGLPINRRATTKSIVAEVKTENIQGTDTPEVKLQNTVIYRPTPLDGKTAMQQAQETADKINKILDAGLKIHELKVENDGVIARNQVLLSVSDADAKLMGKTPTQVANDAAAAIRDVVWKQMVNTLH